MTCHIIVSWFEYERGDEDLGAPEGSVMMVLSADPSGILLIPDVRKQLMEDDE
jgi:hypothetical protein